MEKEDTKKFVNLLKKLSVVFDEGKHISPEKIDIFTAIFSEYEMEQIETGINHVLKTRIYKGFPLPAEIIENMCAKRDSRLKGAWHDYHESKDLGAGQTPSEDTKLKAFLAKKYNIDPAEIRE
ncbi:MAG: hypothetical protein V1759_03025 [bacterium]